ncbi:hypothetical protein HGB25_00460 [Candidatus Saccharibacteria bacterium]|nr:hypothetical protein [Candidatus Saccharibacteria bacterium]
MIDEGGPARKLEDIQPDIKPDLVGIDGGGESTPDRASLTDVSRQESNPGSPSSDSVRDQEVGGSNVIKGPWHDNVTGSKDDKKQKGGFWGKMKKKSAPIAIAMTLLGLGAVGIGGVVGPSLIIVQIKEILFLHTNDMRAATSVRTNAVLRKKFVSVKNSFKFSSDGKCNVSCKFGSMSDTMKRNFEAKGFTVKATEGTGLQRGRWQVDSITFPPSTGITGEITTGKDFDLAMRDNKRAAAFKEVFRSSTAYFLNSKFGSTLKKKFKIDKLSRLSDSVKESLTDKLKTKKDQVKAAMRSIMGLPEIDINAPPRQTAMEYARSDPRFTKTFEFIEGPLKKKSDKLTDFIGNICMIYDVGRGVTAATKIARIAAIASFAMIFLSAADQLKAGDADPDVISTLGEQLTLPDENGKSATDSLGYRMAAYGDSDNLTEEDKKYGAGLSGEVVNSIADLFKVAAITGMSIVAMRALCKVTNNVLVAIGSSCPEQIVAFISVASATAVETVGIGAVVAALGAAAWCATKLALMSAGFAFVLNQLIKGATDKIAKSDVPKLDQDTKGIALGDTLFTGTSQIMGGASSSYGMKAGSLADIKQYAIDSAVINQREDSIARYEAQDTPFDAYNKYSFLGSVIQNTNIAALYGSSSPMSYMGTILSIIPNSFASISSFAGAVTDQKSKLYDNKCDDLGLKSVGIDGDAFCNPSYVMSGEEMNADIDEVIKYMTDNNYIDPDTGEVVDQGSTKFDILAGTLTTYKNEYQNYLEYCADRTVPLGETTGSIVDDNYEWQTGLKCTGKEASPAELEMLKNFRVYTMDKSINDTMDEDLNAVTGDGSSDPDSNDNPADTADPETNDSGDPEPATDTTNPGKPVKGAAIICLDAGHPPNGAGGEPALNLKVAKEVEAELKNRGYHVIMTRTGTGDVSISARPKKCISGKADFMYSFHADGSAKSGGYPYQIYMESDRKQGKTSKSYAKTIQKEVAKQVAGVGGLKDGGLETESFTGVGRLGIFSGADRGGLPAVLTEMVQLKSGGKSALDTASTRRKLVVGIANGIQKLFPIKKAVVAASNNAASSTKTVTINTFGYSFAGPPSGMQLVADVRNIDVDKFKFKHSENGFANSTPRSAETVRSLVMSVPKAQEWLKKLQDTWTPKLTSGSQVAIGCARGHHRSVSLAVTFGNWLKTKAYNVIYNNRDINRSW